MNKKIHLISNAHIDPVWQWEWEEGAAAAVATFRTAAGLCEEFDGYIFCHNEAQLYRWISEYDPKLFAAIVECVKAGKWHIMGGWFNQPDCNMPSGEAFIRQALYGRYYFKKHFGRNPTTAINFDPFGHSRGLVQILCKSGYDSYLFFRPDEKNCVLPAETFTWVGYDGSTVLGQRVLWGYNTQLGRAGEKLKGVYNETKDGGLGICLWGVGNHGGGPSRKDVEDLNAFIAEAASQGDSVVHSTPEQYFADVRAGEAPPEHHGDLNPSMPGCYTSQIRIKQLYRLLENQLFMIEKMCVHAALSGMEYPAADLNEALIDLMTTQFHDTLPGTSVQPVEESSIRMLYHGLETLSRLRARAFFHLADGLTPVKDDELPIVVYNPHPYTVEGILSCEYMLWDHSFEKLFFNPTVYQNGKSVPSQAEKELSNIPIEWRKKVTFHACLEPSSMNYFTVKIEKIDRKPAVLLHEKDGLFHFNNGQLDLIINTKTGLIDRYRVDGKDILAKNACTIAVYADTEDPWSMEKTIWKEQIGEFSLLSPESGSEFSGLPGAGLPSVRVIEDGEVRTVIEAVFGYGNSFALIRYLLPKKGTAIDLEVRLYNSEKRKMLKLLLPAAFSGGMCEGETVFGRQTFAATGRENVSQRYLLFGNESLAFSVANDGIYGSSCENDTLKLTLLRSPAYTAHPIDNRVIMPQDRFSPYIDQGERNFKFRMSAGSASFVKYNVYSDAALLNQPPYCLSFFPSGGGEQPKSTMQLSAFNPAGELLPDGTVELCAFKMAQNSEKFIVRLFNHCAQKVRCTIQLPLLGVSQSVELNAFEVNTYITAQNEWKEINMMEEKNNV